MSLKDQQIDLLEELLVVGGNLVKGEINSNVRAAPVIGCANFTIPVVLSNEGQLCVKRNTHTGIAWELEGGTVVERTHHLVTTLGLCNMRE